METNHTFDKKYRFESIVNSLSHGVCILDKNFIIFINPALSEIIEYETWELIGQHISIIDPPGFNMTLNDQLKYETKLYTKYQKTIDVEFSSTYVRIDGKLVNLVEIRDITKQKEIERALEKSEYLYQRIVEDQMDLICRYLPDGTLTYINNSLCKLMNSTKELMAGMNISNYLKKEYHRLFMNALKKITQFNPVLNTESKFYFEQGMKWIKWIHRGIFNKSGEIIYFQSVGSDLTDLYLAKRDIIKVILRILSRNERKCLMLAVKGLNRKEKAKDMDVLVETVDTYQKRIKKKLNIDNEGLKKLINNLKSLHIEDDEEDAILEQDKYLF